MGTRGHTNKNRDVRYAAHLRLKGAWSQASNRTADARRKWTAVANLRSQSIDGLGGNRTLSGLKAAVRERPLLRIRSSRNVAFGLRGQRLCAAVGQSQEFGQKLRTLYGAADAKCRLLRQSNCFGALASSSGIQWRKGCSNESERRARFERADSLLVVALTANRSLSR